MARFFIRGKGPSLLWYFWKDGKVIEVDIFNCDEWNREEWVGYFLFDPDMAYAVPEHNFSAIVSRWSKLAPASGSENFTEDEVPPEFKLQLLLMGVL